MIRVRWLGRGGQGSFTASRLLGKAASIYEGKYALAFPSFGPERRGAPVLAFTRIDDKKITDRSEIPEYEYLVVMDDTLINENSIQGLIYGGSIVLNSSSSSLNPVLKGLNVIKIDATSIALNILGQPITNTAMLGALIAASGMVSLESVLNSIDNEMKPVVAEKNKQIVQKAYSMIRGR
ncbi:MAG: 2-oxoacid:acceptor oxidoreductase family protein [Spirochaetales bacterium]|nr:2-oxoacid:acceptor oxidoreductase family protein [Spirochaetales bacterium]